MKVRDLMTSAVVRIHPEEPVAVAARTLTQYNIGALPVCSRDGRVCGMVTDRDLVTRCMAAGKDPADTKVGDVMTKSVVSTNPNAEAGAAAYMMGREQVRRLPVVENGRLCGMLSLGDLAQNGENTGVILTEIGENIRKK